MHWNIKYIESHCDHWLDCQPSGHSPLPNHEWPWISGQAWHDLQVRSVIVWEALIEGGGESWCPGWGVWIHLHWPGGELEWLSLHHHGDGDIVVVGDVLGLVSLLSPDGVEGIVADDLSEGLEGNAIDSIQVVSRGNLEGESSLLVDWNGNELRASIICTLWLSESLEGAAQMGMCLGSSFQSAHSLLHKLTGGRRLDGSGLGDEGWADEGSQGKVYNTSHFIIIINFIIWVKLI